MLGINKNSTWATGKQMKTKNCRIKGVELDVVPLALLDRELGLMLTLNWIFVLEGIEQGTFLASAGICRGPSFTDCLTLPASRGE